ncbi:MAG TPA: NRDE family protein, partial [Burkholderiaceae bacterium]|nr:NRDE family protein [Burkholderiaceae bacterium]
DALALQLFEALADRTPAPDAALPTTGIPHELERVLSPAFVRTPDGRYGTRCATVIVTERVRRRLVTHVMERTYTPGAAVALMRRVRLADWPPRYATNPQVEVSPIADSEVEEAQGPTAPPRRTRIRSLLRPMHRLA